MNTFTSVFLAALIISVLVQLWLTFRHIGHVSTHRHAVPEAFADKVSLSNHQKAANYTLANARFSIIELLASTLFLLGWTIGGGLQFIDNFWQGMGLAPLSTGVAVLISVFIIITLLEIPLSLYSTFVIEERFGFNKSTLSLYTNDLIKQIFLTILLERPWRI